MAIGDKIVPFEALAEADLVVNCLYDGGTSKTVADDPISRLLPVGNQGGFRYKGSPAQGAVRIGVLYTTTVESDWPDALDPQTGVFTYYGDNRSPSRELHGTHRLGNVLLRDVFEWSYDTSGARLRVPPFLLFEKAAPGRRVAFRGLLAPGAAGVSPDDELVAIWRGTSGQRFQNYRARFTVLDVLNIRREWLSDVLAGRSAASPHCPQPWRSWLDERRYSPLLAP